MRYEWDINYIIRKRQELADALKTNKDNLKIKTDYDTYDLLLELYISSKIGDDAVFVDDLSNESGYDYSTIPEDIFNDIFKMHSCLREYKFNFNQTEISNITMSNDDIFEIVRSIYREIPDKDINHLFDKFTNNNLIYINYNKFDQMGVLGFTLNDIQRQIPYGIIYRKNTIMDIITLNHEISHMLFRYNESEDYVNSYKYYFSEVEGNLFDLICYNKLLELGYLKRDIITLSNNKLNSQKVLSSEVCNCKSNNDKSLDFDELKETSKDCLSYLCSLDLYELYKNDNEKALYNLRNIIKINSLNINDELARYNITFFEDNCKNLNKYIKKVKRRLN